MKVIITPTFRAAFVNLVQPKLNMQNKLKYSLVMLFDKNKDGELQEIHAEIDSIIKERWGEKIPKGLKTPILDGDTKTHNGFPGSWYINASTERQPAVVDHEVKSISAGEIYPGCYCKASISFWAYDNVQKGISCNLLNVQKVDEGESLLGALTTDPENEFQAITKPKLRTAVKFSSSPVKS